MSLALAVLGGLHVAGLTISFFRVLFQTFVFRGVSVSVSNAFDLGLG